MIIAFFAPRIRQSKRSNTPMSKDQGCVCHFSLLSLALTTKFQALQGLLESLTPSPRASLPKSPCGSSDGKAFSSHRGGTRLTQAPISPACAQYFGALTCMPAAKPSWTASPQFFFLWTNYKPTLVVSLLPAVGPLLIKRARLTCRLL